MHRTLHKVCLPLWLLLISVELHAQSVAEILARANPAVVTISTRDAKGNPGGLGSGFLVGSNGIVITAWHVVSEAATAVVKLHDGRTYDVAGVWAKDADRDFAILTFVASDSPYIPLGNSDKVRQGDRILTLGSPQGLEGTASEGIVSAVRRVGTVLHLQITAPIS